MAQHIELKTSGISWGKKVDREVRRLWRLNVDDQELILSLNDSDSSDMFTMISDHYPYNRFSLNFDVISKKSKEKFREMFEEEPFAGIELVKSAEGNIIRKIYLVG